MQETPGARDLPCREGCSETRADPTGPIETHEVRLHDRPFELRCEPVGDRIVTLLQTVPRPDPDLSPDLAPVDSGQRLTPREIEVLQLLAEGLDGTAIAKTLGISPGTVRTHVEHMRVSLGCRTRAGLVSKGYRLGYLSA